MITIQLDYRDNFFMTYIQNSDGLKNMDAIFSATNNQMLKTITGGKKESQQIL